MKTVWLINPMFDDLIISYNNTTEILLFIKKNCPMHLILTKTITSILYSYEIITVSEHRW